MRSTRRTSIGGRYMRPNWRKRGAKSLTTNEAPRPSDGRSDNRGVAIVALLGGHGLLVELDGEIAALGGIAVDQGAEHGSPSMRGHEVHTIRPVRSIRAATLLLPMTARSSEVMSERLHQAVEPTPHIGRAGEMRGGAGEMLALDLEAEAAKARSRRRGPPRRACRRRSSPGGDRGSGSCSMSRARAVPLVELRGVSSNTRRPWDSTNWLSWASRRVLSSASSTRSKSGTAR